MIFAESQRNWKEISIQSPKELQESNIEKSRRQGPAASNSEQLLAAGPCKVGDSCPQGLKNCTWTLAGPKRMQLAARRARKMTISCPQGPKKDKKLPAGPEK